MSLSSSIGARIVLFVGIAAGVFAASDARGAVTEPNGLTVPLPASAVEVGLAANFTPPAVVSLPALFQVRGEAIDWQKDARTTPAVFSPLCTFTGQLVDHGGACHIDFGWYNVDPARTGPPPDTEIYTIIPGTAIPSPWHPSVGEMGPMFTTASIRSDPHYKGGLIGFALKGDPGADCKQTHFSEQELNVQCTNCTPVKSWAAALIWQSTATPNAYYIGFEDLAMSPTDFGGFAGQPYKNDGDFNDFVYFLSGLTCEGGGTSCDTGMKGVCAAGLNECVSGTMLTCRPSLKPGPEICDGLDNDCNGMIDDGATCPGGGVCDRGRCLPPCGNVEFPCGGRSGLTCVSGLCLETACVGKTCAEGTICKGGACVGPCDGITCPKSQVCRVGRCVDPCTGVTCDSDRVCEGGVCVISCNCRSCQNGQSCAADGHCRETACMGKTCDNGQVCVAGGCVDPCTGAICPTGQGCTAGNCVDAPGMDAGVTVNNDAAIGGSGGARGGGGASAGGGGAGAGAAGGADGGVDPYAGPKIGCGCDLGDGPSATGWLALALAALARTRGSRRSRRR